MKVVLTAPIPGVSTPNFPFGASIVTGLRIQIPPVSIEKISGKYDEGWDLHLQIEMGERE
jgi:hypothetical protein